MLAGNIILGNIDTESHFQLQQNVNDSIIMCFIKTTTTKSINLNVKTFEPGHHDPYKTAQVHNEDFVQPVHPVCAFQSEPSPPGLQ